MDPVLKNIDGTEKLCMGGFGALVPATHTLPLSLHPEVIIQKEQSRWNVGSEGTFPQHAWVFGGCCGRLGGC